ncbi:serine hydrolase [Oscillatoria amoena NRMC-F 0135]|nr:serine hydrolase [Oscillatoria amoena NRMC-F 0135]
MKLIILTLSVLITSNTYAQPIEDKIRQRVDFQETPGIVVGVYEDGKVVYYAYGIADVQTGRAVTAQTLFEIGSITKTFTTSMTAVLSLQKKINFTDSAQKYLPSKMILPKKNGKTISIQHLATAHSGLPRMPMNFSPEDPADPYIDYDEDQLTGFISNYELSRDPGSQYEYSNLGMGLLGYIITRVERKSYSASVTNLITGPLSMNNTFISGQRQDMALATGYSGIQPVKAWTWNDKSVLTGAGGLVSNAEDMMKFMVANLKAASEKTQLDQAFLMTHTPRGDAGKMKIGYGWHIRDEDIVWHNGGTGGFRSFAGFSKSKNKAVVVLTNSNTGADDLGFHLLSDMYPLKELKQPFVVPEVVLQEYTGRYELAPGFIITVTYEGGQLAIQATNQPRATIYSESETKFYLKVVNAQIEFFRDENNTVSKLILYQNGAAIPGRRIN